MKVRIEPEGRVKITTLEGGIDIDEFYISEPLELSGDLSQIWVEPVTKEAAQLEFDY